jgi:hypothetical protein
MVGDHIEIRLAREEDAEEIVNVVRSGFDSSLLNTFIYGCPGITEYIKCHIGISKELSDTAYIVAAVNDRIAGCIELRHNSNGLFLNYISIDSGFRSRGLSKCLLRVSIDYVRNPEHKDLFLDVLEHNTIALNWYRGLGFEHDYVKNWWEIPLRESEKFENIWISDYPQAEVVHSVFGFSKFTLTTSTNQYQIGRIGRRWFRLTQGEALSDSAVLPALWRLDNNRHILLIVPEGNALDSLTNARLLTRTYRMHIDLNRLTEKLTGKSYSRPDPVCSQNGKDTTNRNF